MPSAERLADLLAVGHADDVEVVHVVRAVGFFGETDAGDAGQSLAVHTGDGAGAAPIRGAGAGAQDGRLEESRRLFTEFVIELALASALRHMRMRRATSASFVATAPASP
jgi:hypothetical protein